MTSNAQTEAGARRAGTISSYTLPESDAGVPNTAQWTPDAHRSVLLVHDMQRYFLDFFEPDQRQHIVDAVSTLIAAARRSGVALAYTAQPGSMTEVQRGLLADFWGPGMRAVGAHRDVVAGCEPQPGDIVETKWRYSAFHGNDLAARIAELGRDQVVICGVFASVGCLASAVDAFSRDLQTFFVTDAMGDFNLDDHQYAGSYAARLCAVVMGHREAAAHWAAQGR